VVAPAVGVRDQGSDQAGGSECGSAADLARAVAAITALQTAPALAGPTASCATWLPDRTGRGSACAARPAAMLPRPPPSTGRRGSLPGQRRGGCSGQLRAGPAWAAALASGEIAMERVRVVGRALDRLPRVLLGAAIAVRDERTPAQRRTDALTTLCCCARRASHRWSEPRTAPRCAWAVTRAWPSEPNAGPEPPGTAPASSPAAAPQPPGAEAHHTSVHAGGQISMIDGLPWFIPPPWLDPDQKPIRRHLPHAGGRRPHARSPPRHPTPQPPTPSPTTTSRLTW